MDKSARGRAAEQLLENHLLKEAFTTLREEYRSAWERAETPEARERLWAMQRGLDSVRGHLEEVVTTGQKARGDLDINRKGGKHIFRRTR